MAENQYDPTLSGGAAAIGVEIQVQDASGIGQTAGLADDRVFAEIMRVPPTDGTTIFKRIVPFGVKTSTGQLATITTTGSANNSVLVSPFRAIVGSRVVAGTNPLQNYRDIRSTIYVGTGTTLSTAVPLAPNASGNPRWDLVYCSVTVDTQGGSTTRRLKDPTTLAITSPTVFTQTVQQISITVLTGTPGASPAIPTLPADSGNVYNIPLAVVRVNDGATSGSTVSAADVRDYVNGVAGCDVAQVQPHTGAIRFRAANGNNDGAGTYAASFPWIPGTSAQRPALFLPPSWTGGDVLAVQIDITSNGSPSHANNGIVDSAVDWRGRYFVTHAAWVTAVAFANDRSAADTNSFPNPPTTAFAGNVTPDFQMGHSFKDQSSSGYSIIYLGKSTQSVIAAGATIALAVNMSNGNLVCQWSGTPAARGFLLVQATGTFPNNA